LRDEDFPHCALLSAANRYRAAPPCSPPGSRSRCAPPLPLASAARAHRSLPACNALAPADTRDQSARTLPRPSALPTLPPPTPPRPPPPAPPTSRIAPPAAPPSRRSTLARRSAIARSTLRSLPPRLPISPCAAPD